MNENEIQNSDALQQVEPQRREFLAKLIAGGVALPAMSSVAFAQGAGKGKGGAGKAKGAGGKGKGGAGKGGAGKGKGGQGGPGTSRPDPAEFAARLLKEFDKDGDKALNLNELTAALTKMAERRGDMQGQAGAGKGKGDGAGKGKGKGDGAGKGKGNGEIGGGGVKPKKPGT